MQSIFQSFTQQTSLPGHTDWVRCLSFSLSLDHYTASQQTSNRDILLASGSQDNYIRLWRISQRQSSVSRDKSEAPSSALDILDQLEDPNDSEISSKEYPLGIEGERFAVVVLDPADSVLRFATARITHATPNLSC